MAVLERRQPHTVTMARGEKGVCQESVGLARLPSHTCFHVKRRLKCEKDVLTVCITLWQECGRRTKEIHFTVGTKHSGKLSCHITVNQVIYGDIISLKSPIETLQICLLYQR